LDVDGTLTDTAQVDAECFVQAVSDVFGISEVDTDWSVYPDTTDVAIASYLVQQVHGKSPSSTEIAELRDRFLVLLRAAIGSDASRCRPIPGGPAFVRMLVESPAFSVAIATGGWEESARFKLERAGYDLSDVPLASSNDASSRTAILTIAVERALAKTETRSFEGITYIGDGEWDARAASSLGYRFVRRGDPALSMFGRMGNVVRDFQDFDSLLRTLVDL
jgi:phosphoglycolate phosphatase-like HAD superfamily hydrolase